MHMQMIVVQYIVYCSLSLLFLLHLDHPGISFAGFSLSFLIISIRVHCETETSFLCGFRCMIWIIVLLDDPAMTQF